MNYQGMNIPGGYKDMTNTTSTSKEGKSCGCNQQPVMYSQPMSQIQGCGCCGYAQPTYQGCNQVVNKCFVQDVPHYINYNTHVVNNCIKRHYTVPTYSQTQETVYMDEFVQGQQPMMSGYGMYVPGMMQNQQSGFGPGFAAGLGTGLVAPLIF